MLAQSYVTIPYCLTRPQCVNSSPLNKMAAILADDNFKCIFLNENDRILILISLKFGLRSPIDNKSALVQIMVWHRTGDKPLTELMLTQFTDTYMWHLEDMRSFIYASSFCMCLIKVGIWIRYHLDDIYMSRHWGWVTYMCKLIGSALFPIMACHLFGTKPLPKPILTHVS